MEKQDKKQEQVMFLCSRCAKKLRDDAHWRLFPVGETEEGICEPGQYLHGRDPRPGQRYAFSTPQMREADMRRRQRENPGLMRQAGGGERARTMRGDMG